MTEKRAASRRTPAPQDGKPPEISQTLDRGLAILDLLAAEPKSTSALAKELGLHRSIVHRLVTTLRHRGLVTQDSTGRNALGLNVLGLVNGVEHNVQSLSMPYLQQLATAVAATVTMSLDERDEAVNVQTVEPLGAHVYASVPRHFRHPVGSGADGIALASLRPPSPDEREDVAVARDRGWAISHGEIVKGMAAVAVAFQTDHSTVSCAVSVIFLEERIDSDLASIVAATQDTAQQLRALFGGH